MNTELRKDLLEAANWLLPGEELTEKQHQISLVRLVERILADSDTPCCPRAVIVALILARHAET